jgi:uncharacterized protein (TIGR02677 family)
MRDPNERLRVFAYLDAEKTAIYRPIMRTFLRAKEMFAIHLRPADLSEPLGSNIDLADVGSALEQLCEWGNLEKHADAADVATVEDFYKPRYLFQLTREGEAAERGLENTTKLLSVLASCKRLRFQIFARCSESWNNLPQYHNRTLAKFS